MSADEDLGYVYLPFSTSSNVYYGGHRHGDNLFGETLVCLDARTGRRIWHYQIVRHGLWDYDLPAAPNLQEALGPELAPEFLKVKRQEWIKSTTVTGEKAMKVTSNTRRFPPSERVRVARANPGWQSCVVTGHLRRVRPSGIAMAVAVLLVSFGFVRAQETAGSKTLPVTLPRIEANRNLSPAGQLQDGV